MTDPKGSRGGEIVHDLQEMGSVRSQPLVQEHGLHDLVGLLINLSVVAQSDVEGVAIPACPRDDHAVGPIAVQGLNLGRY